MDLETILGTSGVHHHAVALHGDRSNTVDAILSFIESVHAMRRHKSPDLWILETDAFSIGDARLLREKASLQGIAGSTHVFVIAFDSATLEAQNALLKLLEEPPSGAYFFIAVPSVDALIPTVQSRLFVVSHHAMSEGNESPIDVSAFLKKNPGERLKMLEPMLKRAGDEKTKTEALKDARLFVRALTRALSEDGKRGKGNARGLSRAARAGSYLSDRSPSIKMLLEYLAISV